MTIVRTSISLNLSDKAFEIFKEQKNKSLYIQTLIEEDSKMLQGKAAAFLNTDASQLSLRLESLEKEIGKLLELSFKEESSSYFVEEIEEEPIEEKEEMDHVRESELSEEEIATLDAFMNWGCES